MAREMHEDLKAGLIIKRGSIKGINGQYETLLVEESPNVGWHGVHNCADSTRANNELQGRFETWVAAKIVEHFQYHLYEASGDPAGIRCTFSERNGARRCACNGLFKLKAEFRRPLSAD